MRTAFIYGLRCPLTGLIRYIGKCDDPKTRLLNHLKDPDKNHRTNWIASLKAQSLKPALEVIAEVPYYSWQFWERSYIRAYRQLGFDLVNGTDGGEGGMLTAEIRAKISEAHKGKKKSPEHCAKIGVSKKGENHPNFGKKLSPETRSKIGAAHKGKKLSPEHRAKISEVQKGKKLSPETRAKLSELSKGRKFSPETRAKISASKKRLCKLRQMD